MSAEPRHVSEEENPAGCAVGPDGKLKAAEDMDWSYDVDENVQPPVEVATAAPPKPVSRRSDRIQSKTAEVALPLGSPLTDIQEDDSGKSFSALSLILGH
jgi:hypothetical protein